MCHLFSYRPIKDHDLPEDFCHVGQGVRRQAETAGVDKLSDQLLPVLLHGLANQTLPQLEVILVLRYNKTYEHLKAVF